LQQIAVEVIEAHHEDVLAHVNIPTDLLSSSSAPRGRCL
jgi:hypothetical protein